MSGASRFIIRSAGSIRFVDESEVRWIESVGPYVRMHLGSDSALYRAAMSELEERLHPRFVRVHRSYMVRVELVRELRKRGGSRYEVYLADGHHLPVGESYERELLERLGV